MTSGIGRRGFLGSATAAGVGATVVALGRPVRANTHHTTHGDPQIDAIGREVARIVQQMPTTQGPGPLLAMASAMRLFASAVEARGGDEPIRAAIERWIRMDGRAAVLTRVTSPEIIAHRRQLLASAGIPFHQETIPDAVYETQLQALLAGQSLTTHTHRSAASLEAAYAALQTRRIMTPGVRRVRQDPAAPAPEEPVVENPILTHIFRCAYLTEQCDHYSALASIVCGAAANLAPLLLAFAPICAGLGLAAGGYCYAAYHYEC